MCTPLINLITVACIITGVLAALAGYFLGRANGARNSRSALVRAIKTIDHDTIVALMKENNKLKEQLNKV